MNTCEGYSLQFPAKQTKDSDYGHYFSKESEKSLRDSYYKQSYTEDSYSTADYDTY